MWATADFVPYSEVLGSPHDEGYVANPPTFTPPPILSPALKRWEPLTRQGLCSQSAHWWATFHFVPCSKALETPQIARVVQPPLPHLGHCCFCPLLSGIQEPPHGKRYVAKTPICGPLMVLSLVLKRWGAPRLTGVMYLPGTSEFVPRFEALQTPHATRVMWPRGVGRAPIPILSPNLKRWGDPRRHGLCSH